MSSENQPENVEPMSEIQPTSEEITAETAPAGSVASEPADLMMAAMEAQAVDSAALIYVGPTIKGLSQYSVFTNGIPPYMESKFERCPELRSLFLPVQELPSRRDEWNLVGSELYVSYQAVLKTKGV